jgi:hypothetical protein
LQFASRVPSLTPGDNPRSVERFGTMRKAICFLDPEMLQNLCWPSPPTPTNPRPTVQIVALVATGSYRAVAKLAEASDFRAPANALPALTKKLCRWHCERHRQDDGIHRHAAGNVLRSRFLRTDRPQPRHEAMLATLGGAWISMAAIGICLGNSKRGPGLWG